MATGSSSTCPEPVKTNLTPQNPILAEVSAPLIENLLPEIIFEILLRLPVKFLLRFRNICVNGILHWTASRKSHEAIVSLDLVKETFGEVLQPDYVDGHSQLMLHVVSGCLCVVYDYDGISAEVWVMKEYGTPENEMCVIPGIEMCEYNFDM
ncbi:hypothetical protein RHMOL_Rhmol02G0060400 [Rhododendron molle]|uniref:Uncharacterized protein n=1 Tax=Rhododendron molle TaxID=49168 RepID=A0ACC0PLW2_RHOML|nr:hypothetical protein RHMOL_Rhmol02G0060400 [Rhododendron molle]